MGQDRALLVDEPAELVDAELGDEELDAGAIAVRLLSQAPEDPGDRLDGGQELFDRVVLVEQLRLVRRGAQPAADVEIEGALLDPVDRGGAGDGAEVVHHHQAAGLAGAAREGGLELAPEVLAVGVAEQEAEEGRGIGGGVEGLGVAHARERAGREVAHPVAARLAGGDADRRQTPHQVGGVVDVDVVELDVLAGGDVEDRVRVLLGQLGHHLELLGRRAAVGELDAHHPGRVPERLGPLCKVSRGELQRLRRDAVVAVAVVVALSVDPAPQTGLGEDPVLDLALSPQLHLALEDVDLLGQVRRHVGRQPVPPLGRAHPTALACSPEERGKYQISAENP